MPLPSGRMTKNQDRTLRYRPGRATAEDDWDENDDEDSDQEEARQTAHAAQQSTRATPAATTFPTHKKLPVQAGQKAIPKPDLDLEGFVTASESSDSDQAESSADSDDDDEDESDDDEQSEDESSSEEDTKPKLIAPKFISKAQRSKLQANSTVRNDEEVAQEEERRRQENANQLLQNQIERDQAARAAGKKAWDDDDAPQDDVDDTDDVDPEAEHAAWKLRELRRIRRDREALVEREKEREEIERRRNLTVEEREAEDQEIIDQQKADQDGRGKMGYMQRYFHKGAFFNGDEDQDDEVKAALSRDLAGARFVDESSKEVLPDYMRIRDMTKLGRKGRSKYKDLKSEDTGRWGVEQRSRDNDLDDRFRSDDLDRKVITGANMAPVNGRRQREQDDAGKVDDEKRQRYS